MDNSTICVIAVVAVALLSPLPSATPLASAGLVQPSFQFETVFGPYVGPYVGQAYAQEMMVKQIFLPSLPPVADITNSTEYPTLAQPYKITTVQIGQLHYALVASTRGDGVQIINITNPGSPKPSASIMDDTSDGFGGTFAILEDVYDVTTVQIGSFHYALAVSPYDDGVQIINITDPASPRATASVTDGASDGFGGTFEELKSVIGITTTQIGSSYYALVVAYDDNGVQIINITDPASPRATANITDGASDGFGGTFAELDSANGITTTQIGPFYYALVSANTDHGVQIINITDPASPRATASITDGASDGFGGTFEHLNGAAGITTVQIGPFHYALVTASADNGVQVVDITDPASPRAAASATDGTAYPELRNARGVTTTQIGSSHYALVTAFFDDGVQIIKLSRYDYNLTIASDNADTTRAKLNDTITVTLVDGGTLSDANATVFGKTATIEAFTTAVTNDSLRIAVNVTSGTAQGTVAFSIHARDSTGDLLYVTESDLDSANVFVDTAAPRLTLNGNPYTTAALGAVYEDLGAFVTDGDPLYTGSVSSDASAVDSSKVGTYIVEYSAPDDPAGNGKPANLMRTVSVVPLSFLPSLPPVANITQGVEYPILVDPGYITTTQIGTSYYALTTAFYEHGVQIINITDPASPNATVSITHGASDGFGGTFNGLQFASDITTTQIGPSHYALVAANGIQIINITDPASPRATVSIADGTIDGFGGTFEHLNGITGVTTTQIGQSHYALAVDIADNGVQIINITDPASPRATANITDGASDGFGGTFEKLDRPRDITTTQIGQSHYALITSTDDVGVQIINITDPSSPRATANITDGASDGFGGTFNGLSFALDITTTQIGSSHYVLISTGGLHIINITDPSSPRVTAHITDGASDGFGGTFEELRGTWGIATIQIGSSHYALATGTTDHGVQVVDITDPASPRAAASAMDGTAYPTLSGARAITTTQIGQSQYALVTAIGDDGIQIIKLSRYDYNLTIASDNADTTRAKLNDTITVTLVDGAMLSDANATVFGKTAAIEAFTTTVANDSLRATIITESDAAQGSIAFSIHARDSTGDLLHVTESDLDSANVFVDTIAPRLTLNGNPHTTAALGAVYEDSGAVVTDGDPLYTGRVSSNASAIDASKVGTYVIEYSAPDDLAGNGKPANLTRTVSVVPLSFLPSIPPAASITDGVDYPILNSPFGVATVQIGQHHYALVAASGDSGVQIINITDPSSPNATASITDGASDGFGGTFNKLRYPLYITTTQIGSSHYALVTANGLQIINITDPSSPRATASATDGTSDGFGGTFEELTGPWDITTVQIGASHYALVAAASDDGVQIINITDPASPRATASITDGTSDGFGGTFEELAGPFGITTVQIGKSYYALTAAIDDNGVQIINITDPASPRATANITDDAFDGFGGTFDKLNKSAGIAAVQIGSSHYALVTAYGDNGVQIINITDPSSPRATANITYNASDGFGGTFEALFYPWGITTTQIGSSHYALVTAFPGVQIINITDPTSPRAAASATSGTMYPELLRSRGVTVTQIDSSHYALIASVDGNGVQIIKLSRYDYNLTIASDNADTTRAKLNDTITVTLVDGGALSDVNATVFGKTATIEVFTTTVANDSLRATVTTESDVAQGTVAFSIHARDSAGDLLHVTESDLDSENVLVDTVAPKLSLNGNRSISIDLGESYTDQSATVSDDDTSYSGTVSSNASNVNTSKAGTYVISYSAPADPAGNNPATITRTVIVEDTAAPLKQSLIISSDNANDMYAKAGDTITVTLVANKEIVSASATGLNNSAQATVQNNTVTVRTAVQAGDGGNATFSLTASDAAGNMLAVTQADLDSPNVFVDNLPPTLTLNGDQNVTIDLGDTYAEQGANVTDNDPSYGGTVSTAGTVDTSAAGTYILTYSAPADPAGNEPASVTRNVTVRDADGPSKQILNIFSANVNAQHARAGDAINVVLTADMDTPTASAIILGKNATVITFEKTTIANVTVSQSDEGYATFSLTASNSKGETLTVTQADLNSPNILVDNQAPVITLNGNSNITIKLGNAYAEQGATVTDNDPSYGGTVSTAGTVDASAAGTYILTYSAPADLAGNAPASITRNVTVQDDMEYSLGLGGSDSPDYAKYGDIVTAYLYIPNPVHKSATILGESVQPSGITDYHITYEYTVHNNPPTGYPEFSITVDSGGKAFTFTDDNVTGKSVFVDAVPPIIALHGYDVITIQKGTPLSELPKATATDDDPAYETRQISPTGYSPSQTGTVQVVYAAPADSAGNEGQSLTRTVKITENAAGSPPDLENLISWSQNEINWLRATVGDRVHVDLNIGNGTFTLTSFTIAGKTVENPHTIDEHDYHPTPLEYSTEFELFEEYLRGYLALPEGTPEGTLHFEIKYTRNGISYTVTQDDITGVSVLVDTIAPGIYVDGPDGYLIPAHSDLSEIPQATVTDDDPSYVTHTVRHAENIDTSRLGTSTITYAANADPAGNAPIPVTRDVTVYESASWSENTVNWLSADAGDRVYVDLGIGDGTFTLTSFTIAGVSAPEPHMISIRDNSVTMINYGAEYAISEEFFRGAVDLPEGTPEGTLQFELNYARNGISYTVTQDEITGVSVTVNGP